jgi:hypothetical protein
VAVYLMLAALVVGLVWLEFELAGQRQKFQERAAQAAAVKDPTALTAVAYGLGSAFSAVALFIVVGFTLLWELVWGISLACTAKILGNRLHRAERILAYSAGPAGLFLCWLAAEYWNCSRGLW